MVNHLADMFNCINFLYIHHLEYIVSLQPVALVNNKMLHHALKMMSFSDVLLHAKYMEI